MVAHAADTEGPKKRQAFESPQDLKESTDFRGSFSGYESNRFFINGGAGKPFMEAGYPCGVAAQTDGRAVAAFDLEGDGRPDLAVLSLQDLRVYRNQVGDAAGHYVDITLVDASGGPALGAKIRVDAGEQSVVDRSRLTMGFHTQVMPRAHLGLGPASIVDTVQVRWPSGRTQTWRRLKVDRHYRLEEGRDQPTEVPRPRWNASVIPAPSQVLTTSSLTINTLDGQPAELTRNGQPTIVNLWAPWCAPCAIEAPELEKLHKANGKQVMVVGVSVEANKLDANKKFITTHGLTYPNFMVTQQHLAKILGSAQQLKLPTTLIFDGQGRLVRRFNRAVRLDELTRWVKNLQLLPTPEDYDRQTVILEADGDGFAGIEVLQQAVRQAPKEPLRHMKLARLAASNGQSEIAIDAARTAVSLSKRSEEGWSLLLSLLSRFKGPQVALDSIMKAPQTPTLMVLKANMLLQLGRGDDGLKLMKQAIKLRPKNVLWKRQLNDYLDKKARGFRPNHNRK